MSDPTVQYALRDAEYATLGAARSHMERGIALRKRILSDPSTRVLPNFFLDAGGQSENEDDDMRDGKSEDTDTSSRSSSEGDENPDRSGEDSDPPYTSEDEYNSESQ